MPDHEIIDPQVVEGIIGSAEFEDRSLSEMEKNSAGHWRPTKADENDMPLILCQRLTMDVLKETKWLWWHAVPFAGLAKQAMKNPHRVQILGELDGQAALLGFSNGPPRRVIDPSPKRRLIMTQIEPVAKKGG